MTLTLALSLAREREFFVPQVEDALRKSREAEMMVPTDAVYRILMLAPLLSG